jgi:hypothetical protein
MGNDLCNLKSSCCQLSQHQKYELSVENPPPTHRLPINELSVQLYIQRMITEVRAASDTVDHFSVFNAERLTLLQECVHYSKVCKLQVLRSGLLPKETIFKLDAQGCSSSLRGANDGVTYIGCRKRLKGDPRREIVNDIVIPSADPQYDELHRGRHLQIAFDPDLDAYFARDLGVGFGTFMKVDFTLTLRNTSLLQMGASFLIIAVPPTDPTLLKVKVSQGVAYGEEFSFSAAERTSIIIGREHDSHVPIEDSLLSKHQAVIAYHPSQGWILKDGDLLSGKASTNGTW